MKTRRSVRRKTKTRRSRGGDFLGDLVSGLFGPTKVLPNAPPSAESLQMRMNRLRNLIKTFNNGGDKASNAAIQKANRFAKSIITASSETLKEVANQRVEKATNSAKPCAEVKNVSGTKVGSCNGLLSEIESAVDLQSNYFNLISEDDKMDLQSLKQQITAIKNARSYTKLTLLSDIQPAAI